MWSNVSSFASKVVQGVIDEAAEYQAQLDEERENYNREYYDDAEDNSQFLAQGESEDAHGEEATKSSIDAVDQVAKDADEKTSEQGWDDDDDDLDVDDDEVIDDNNNDEEAEETHDVGEVVAASDESDVIEFETESSGPADSAATSSGAIDDSRMSVLEEDLETLKAKERQHVAMMMAKNQELETARTEIQKAHAEIAKTREALAASQAETQEALASCRAAQSNVEDLKVTTRDQTRALADVQRELDEFAEDNVALMSMEQELREFVKSKDAELVEANKAVEDLRRELQEVHESSSRSGGAEALDHEEALTALKSSHARDALSEAEDKIALQARELDAARAASQTGEETGQSEEHARELADLSAKYQDDVERVEKEAAERLEAAVAKVRRELEAKKEAEAKRHEVELRHGDAEAKAKQASITEALDNAAREHAAELETARENLEDKHARALEQARSEHQSALENLRNELEIGTTERLSKLEQDAAGKAEKSHSMHLEQVSRLEADLEAAKTELDALRNDAGVASATQTEELRRLEARVEELTQSSTSLEEAREALSAEVDRLESSLAVVSKERDALRAEAQGSSEEAHAELARLGSRVEELTLEAKSLEEELRQVTRERDDVQERLASLNAAFDKLQENARVTLESENELRDKCAEYEEILDEMEAESQELKEKYHEADEERHQLRQQVKNLQSEVKKLSQTQKQGVSTMTGQLGEIERLRKEVENLESREASLRAEIAQHTGQQQQVHKLSDELQVTQAELRVSETDLQQLRSERESLNAALLQLNAEADQRAHVYKRKIDDLRREVQEHRQSMEENKQRFEVDRVELAKEAHEMRLAAAAADRTIEVLRAEVDALKRAEEDWSNSQEAARQQELQRQQSSELDPSALEEIEKTVGGQQHLSGDGGDTEGVDQGDSSAHELLPDKETSGRDKEGGQPRQQQAGSEAAADDDGRVDREVMKKLVVTYFVQKQSGSFHSQRELLTLLANLLNMGQSDREALGLSLPRRSSTGGSFFGGDGKQGGSLSSGDSMSLLKKVIFGDADQDAERAKREVDWEAIEKAVTVKPFTDLWQDFLSNDL
ncbi:Laminin subunit alpha-3 [Hondaea fermentalgiana]|uniref:Laminin subunit alpha-3 n=1 Tax=Hondaea fermentalgiana TaxID=2315210 RepID=A0A2R5GK48_9STRA|nr:Laminin subunit alpha-3 [Hondaea fermentalgiana]|eukprot:GBG31282.1 Laminin subunit alpha-3 [Hondaea fermentalgiana]